MIEFSGNEQQCFSIHKRKNVRRLDKKERLRESNVVAQNTLPTGTMHNPFKPIVEETNGQEKSQSRLGGKYLAIARGNREIPTN